MKRIITINDNDIIEESLRDFQTYIEGMYIKPDESFFSKELEAQLVEYYRAEDPKVEAVYKKMIGIAVIQACNDCPDIPKKYKQNVAKRMVDEVVQCVEASKETYNYLCSKGRYDCLAPGTKSALQERQKAIREYKVVRKAQRVIKFKSIVKRVGGRIASKAAVGFTTLKTTGSAVAAAVAATATSLANVLIPKTVREKMQEKAEEVKTIVVDRVRTALDIAKNKLNETPFGKKVVSVVSASASVISEIGSEIKEIATNVGQAITTGAKKAGNFLNRKWNSFKSIFA
ncbi:MAG: hypothetical protein IKO26_00085 [Paludibacteraceae bacterium]|nr:hypothetical protein [Paludibacteraceae bacterium]